MKVLFSPPLSSTVFSNMKKFSCSVAFFKFLIYIISLPGFSNAQQTYFNNTQLDCYKNISYLNGYICNGLQSTCLSYLTFRSKPPYDSSVTIASLLNSFPTFITTINNITDAEKTIPTDTQLIVPVNCSCSASYYQNNSTYSGVYDTETYFTIANGTYQGLTTCQALLNQNPYEDLYVPINVKLSIPLMCACPSTNQTANGFKYILSYMVTWGDSFYTIAQTFGVDVGTLLDANELSSNDTIYPFNPILIPLKTRPTKIQKVATAPTVVPKHESDSSKKWVYVGVGIGSFVLVLLGFLVWFVYRCCPKQLPETVYFSKGQQSNQDLLQIGGLSGNYLLQGHGRNGQELPIFTFDSVEIATGNFSSVHLLGKGGFGLVYKGTLKDGREVAIKRLSKSSGQGLQEFKNEIVLIAKLQHTNLVRLLGYCAQGEEKMLIYEYMPNKSLDLYLFDQAKKAQLDWKKRTNIIEGIAQGLLYLHKYSRLRIIHRDLKANNILLDGEMNPKISDFGIARIFGKNDNEASTNRIVGTYGYMSPEYAMEGTFSVKSDVYSYGVLLLEIVSGRKNTGFTYLDGHTNLIGQAWDLWQNRRIIELIDPCLDASFHGENLLRKIHVGLLCVQEKAMDRPTMSDVLSMLTNELMILPAPKQSAFLFRGGEESLLLKVKDERYSSNEQTVTALEAR